MIPHPKEMFLSHSSLDGEFASKIADLLRRHGISVWHGPTSIRGGDQWHDEIGAALERCDWFVILLSPNSMKSAWMKLELVYALKEERYKKRIVPVLIRVFKYHRFSWTFHSYQLVDFTEDFEKGCRALLRIWGIGYQATNPDA